jgi:hypothetical protein
VQWSHAQQHAKVLEPIRTGPVRRSDYLSTTQQQPVHQKQQPVQHQQQQQQQPVLQRQAENNTKSQQLQPQEWVLAVADNGAAYQWNRRTGEVRWVDAATDDDGDRDDDDGDGNGGGGGGSGGDGDEHNRHRQGTRQQNEDEEAKQDSLFARYVDSVEVSAGHTWSCDGLYVAP